MYGVHENKFIFTFSFNPSYIEMPTRSETDIISSFAYYICLFV